MMIGQPVGISERQHRLGEEAADTAEPTLLMPQLPFAGPGGYSAEISHQ